MTEPGEVKTTSETTSVTTPSAGHPGSVDTVSTTTTTTKEDPVVVAKRLGDAPKVIADALKQVRRRQRWLWGVTAVLAILVAVVGWQAVVLDDAQERSCRAGNNVRAGLLHIADTLEQAQAEPRPDGRER